MQRKIERPTHEFNYAEESRLGKSAAQAIPESRLTPEISTLIEAELGKLTNQASTPQSSSASAYYNTEWITPLRSITQTQPEALHSDKNAARPTTKRYRLCRLPDQSYSWAPYPTSSFRAHPYGIEYPRERQPEHPIQVAHPLLPTYPVEMGEQIYLQEQANQAYADMIYKRDAYFALIEETKQAYALLKKAEFRYAIAKQHLETQPIQTERKLAATHEQMMTTQRAMSPAERTHPTYEPQRFFFQPPAGISPPTQEEITWQFHSITSKKHL